MRPIVYVGDQPVENCCLRILLRSWAPKPTVASTIWTYAAFAVAMFAISIVLYVYNSGLGYYLVQNYDSIPECGQQGSTCGVRFNLSHALKGPVYLQYGLTKFQQNNKRYMVSKSGAQLYGDIITQLEAKRLCGHVVYNKDLNSNNDKSWGGTPLDPNAVANPCGYIAKSFFNDTYQLSFENGTSIFINQSGISWPFDNGRKFRKAPNSSEIQWIDPTNQHFMVWMRAAGRQNFLKPWGIIEEGLREGSYVLTINNNYNSRQYNSHKSIKLSSVGAIGAQNFTLPIVLNVFGVVFLIGCVVFACRYRMTNGKFGPRMIQ